ncbi:MAG TPA: enoyl-CoA hydratase [Bryobacteraceae bacterium]|nr:enoyl-CoA hydratase [Bryobacteraceae bacterium]
MKSNLYSNIENGIATVTLNRPERRNALSIDLTLELLECLHRLEVNRAVQVIILASEGSVFCSGHDLNEMLQEHPSDYKRIFCACTHLMTKIQSIPQPVIAEVQGLATAAGCQLVASCDLAIASEKASFATPGVRIGLFCSTPMVALTRAIGRKRAMEMLLTGEPIDAYQASEWGLVNRVVPAQNLRSATRTLAERIAEASPVVVGIGKNAFYKQIELDQTHAYAFASQTMSANAQEPEAQEGIRAFLEKRPARWPHHAQPQL